MLRKKAAEHPEKYFAVDVLKSEGYSRYTCKTCSVHFWSAVEDGICGDPACSGGFRFLGDTPATKKLDYIQSWKAFAKHFEERGYTPIKRYPVAARWRDDTDFVQASIYGFQPYVVSGEVEPPANPLVVPQFCLRFNDIDNVGITGAHYTGFVMIGQHAFMKPKDWNQDQYFSDIHSWLIKGLGLPKNEIKYHEDAWAGGGNFGPCMEFFSRGLELGNQVYMQYEVTGNSYKELQLKVLDMGMGQERNAWFTTGTSTSYESTFPGVAKKLYGITGIKPDDKLIAKFLPYSSYLNIDEVEDIDKVWKEVAAKVGVHLVELQHHVLPLSQLYSVAEHTRTLLVALSDGVLPSNSAGGYNLRVLLRRALSIIERNGWNINLADVCRWHAEYLKPQFPELSEHLDDVHRLLAVEEKKFAETKKRSAVIVEREVKKGISQERLLELYDSSGINPEVIKDEAEAQNVNVEVPDNFYALVAARHEQQEQRTATIKEKKLDLAGVPDTEALYFDDWKAPEFTASVVKIVGNDIVLDKTYFYPTSGGQEHDNGTINGQPVIDVFKQGAVILHQLAEPPKFSEGAMVTCQIDAARRKQLAQHHTATHILNGVARKVLGNHIWQAGAAKFLDKARLDITHYEALSPELLKELEEKANHIIKKQLPVKKSFMSRTEAEQKYGFAVYQGGVVPGKRLRIVDIDGLDVEACGGTHLNNTGEAEELHIIRSSKIQDGIVRIEFAAGKAAEALHQTQQQLINETAAVLGGSAAQIPGRAQELFMKWKQIVKKKQKLDDYALTSTTESSGDVLAEAAAIFKTQPEHVPKIAKRFIEEMKSTEKTT